MRPSTLAELIGFAAITYAVYRVNPTAGIAVAGVVLLLIAYATEDDRAAVSLVRMMAPARVRWERLKAGHRARLEARQERRAARTPRREVVLRVKAD
jgi:hypothetical protein